MWTLFVTCLASALLLTPLVRRWALRRGFVDRPAQRKLHREPMPLLGGVALYFAVWGPVAWIGGFFSEPRSVAIFAAVTCLALMGLLDDRRSLPVAVKLVAQLAAAGLLLAAGVVLLTPLPLWGDVLLSLLWVVGITNAVNLLDNMDGVAAGVSALSAFALLALAIRFGAGTATVLMVALAGAALGFLPYNFAPARIFMGDSGSFLLGSSLAVAGIEAHNAASIPLTAALAPIFALALPIFDTTLVSLSRLRRGLNPLKHPGKDHLAHRLLQRGWSVRGTTVFLYGAALLLGALGGWVSTATGEQAWAVAALVGALALALLLWCERQKPLPTGE